MLEHPALTLSASCFVHRLTGVDVETRLRPERMIRPLVEVPNVRREWVVAFGAEQVFVGHGFDFTTGKADSLPPAKAKPVSAV